MYCTNVQTDLPVFQGTFFSAHLKILWVYGWKWANSEVARVNLIKYKIMTTLVFVAS